MNRGFPVLALTLAALMAWAGPAEAEQVDRSLLKVTIAVDGMMKSKSGAI